jgi:hypothetical protein
LPKTKGDVFASLLESLSCQSREKLVDQIEQAMQNSTGLKMTLS